MSTATSRSTATAATQSRSSHPKQADRGAPSTYQRNTVLSHPVGTTTMPRTDGAKAATFRLHPGMLCEKDTLAEGRGFEPPVPSIGEGVRLLWTRRRLTRAAELQQLGPAVGDSRPRPLHPTANLAISH